MTEPTESPDMNAVQNELMDMIIADESPSNISDRIKDMLYAKSAERVDTFRPTVASDTFGDNIEVPGVEDSVEPETEVQPEE